MESLPDQEFENLFKQKLQGFDYSFEEEAWLLMEKKLRKRDRIVFVRKASAAFLILLLCVTGLYFLLDQKPKSQLISKKPAIRIIENEALKTHKENNDIIQDKQPNQELRYTSSKQKTLKREKPDRINPIGRIKTQILLPATDSPENTMMFSRGDTKDEDYISLILPDLNKALSGSLNFSRLDSGNHRYTLRDPVKFNKKPTLSFTFSAGPDFSSIESIAGEKGNLNGGLLVNLGFKKFTLSTGARYGSKVYQAHAYDYQLKNPARANSISAIDASCNVLEVPLQVSYALMNKNKQKVEINTSLSSYFMLKETYRFDYTPESGVNDFVLERNNANQHLFSVVSLSASYKFKPIHQSFQLGIEPYVKLPLAGVGEGKVHLKSSGISLNITYDISKKH